MISGNQYAASVGTVPQERLQRYAARTAGDLARQGASGDKVLLWREVTVQRRIPEQREVQRPRKVLGITVGTITDVETVDRTVADKGREPALRGWELLRQTQMEGYQAPRETYKWIYHALLGEDGALYLRHRQDNWVNRDLASDSNDVVVLMSQDSYEFWDREHTLQHWWRDDGSHGRSLPSYGFRYAAEHCVNLSRAIKRLRVRNRLS